MPVYEGIDGVVRKRKEWPIGIDGVVRQQKEHWAGIDGVKRQIFSAGTPVGNLAVGGVVQLNENGVAQDYLCVHQGLPSSLYDSSCDGTWLLRKNIINTQVWNPEKTTAYANSSINAWLNSTMLSTYDAKIQNGIKQVKIPYCLGNGSEVVKSGAYGLACRVFLLCALEVGWRTSYKNPTVPIDGAILSYFSPSGTINSNRIAYYNGSPVNWFLRSPNLGTEGTVAVCVTFGSLGFGSAINIWGIRPCIILPKNFVL